MNLLIGTRKNSDSIETTYVDIGNKREFLVVYNTEKKVLVEGINRLKEVCKGNYDYKYDLLDLEVELMKIDQTSGDIPYIILTGFSIADGDDELDKKEQDILKWKRGKNSDSIKADKI